MSLNLTFLILPIEVDAAEMLALTPFVEVTSLNLGSLSKLNPLDRVRTLPILPLIALEDLVVYSNLASSWV